MLYVNGRRQVKKEKQTEGEKTSHRYLNIRVLYPGGVIPGEEILNSDGYKSTHVSCFHRVIGGVV